MSIRDIDDGARAALHDVRVILQRVFNDEMKVGKAIWRFADAGEAERIKRGLIEISRTIEKQLRRYEISWSLVAIADPAARARYEAGSEP